MEGMKTQMCLFFFWLSEEVYDTALPPITSLHLYHSSWELVKFFFKLDK